MHHCSLNITGAHVMCWHCRNTAIQEQVFYISQHAILDAKEMKRLTLLLLILAGEAIFFLPFVLARVFRPTVLEVLNINNFELGVAFSIYGIVAMCSYFLGGPLADRYAPKNLMGLALIMTACGGFYLASYPSTAGLRWLYGFWGASTILLFWAALIRATREYGGQSAQGRAFGWLDGGRGLVAAVSGSAAVLIFQWFAQDSGADSTSVDKKEAFRQVVYFYSAVTCLIGILILVLYPATSSDVKRNKSGLQWSRLKELMHLPALWLQAIIIICAYVGYKSTDDFSLYAREVLKYSDVKAAKVGTLALYMRPVVAIFIGWLGDFWRPVKALGLSFLLMLLGSLALSIFDLSGALALLFFISVISMTIGIYGLRALYFAIMDEGGIPIALTGTAVGLVSLIGYTPDVFWGPTMGYLLDSAPGLLGHQRLFRALSFFAMAGLICSISLDRLNKKTGAE